MSNQRGRVDWHMVTGWIVLTGIFILGIYVGGTQQ